MACFSRDVSIAFLALLGLFTLVAARTSRDEVDDQSAFSYSWNHSTGPTNWAKLNPNWTACGGKFQSPIDLVDNRVFVLPALGNLVRHYKSAPAVIKNRGHDITVEWTGDAGGVFINRTLYALQQCHWHSPSEHTVNGKRYEMEIHLVHKDALGHIAVVGIMYRLGRPDPFLANLLKNVRTDKNGTMTGVANQNATMNGGAVARNGTAIGIVNPMNIRFTSRQYLRYMGSLTTPPCTEGVLWTVLKAVKTVSRRQMRALRNAVADGFEDNARPIQHYPNPVYMYNPEMAP